MAILKKRFIKETFLVYTVATKKNTNAARKYEKRKAKRLCFFALLPLVPCTITWISLDSEAKLFHSHNCHLSLEYHLRETSK